MIDHIELAVSDYQRSLQFYTRALAPLGMTLLNTVEGWSGFGRGNRACFWLGEDSFVQKPLHIAFAAQSREQVDAFYCAAIAAGGTDNGRPGIRAHYHASYYGAFVFDWNKHNIEAVFHG